MNSIQVEKNISLSNFTTWGIGGPAEWIAQPKTIEELKYVINWTNKKKIPCNVIGAGSNLLINDEGIKGLSLCMRNLKEFKLIKTMELSKSLAVKCFLLWPEKRLHLDFMASNGL